MQRVQGSFLDTVGNLVVDTLKLATDAARGQIENELQTIVVKELNSLFPLLLTMMNSQTFNFYNDWTPGYRKVPALSPKYQQTKIKQYKAAGPDYFLGRYGLAERHKKTYKRGPKKGRERYPYKRSLHARVKKLAAMDTGNTLFRALGGIGSQTTVKGGVDRSKGLVVDGKPMKYGARGNLVGARWQDIVSKEYVNLVKKSRFKLKTGYSRRDNPDKIQRPDGRVISLSRAIAEGAISISVKGSFFKNLEDHDQGFLNLLIKRTDFLKLPSGSAPSKLDASPDRLIANLKHMASHDRLIIDPVFGEVLENIQAKFEQKLGQI